MSTTKSASSPPPPPPSAPASPPPAATYVPAQVYTCGPNMMECTVCSKLGHLNCSPGINLTKCHLCKSYIHTSCGHNIRACDHFTCHKCIDKHGLHAHARAARVAEIQRYDVWNEKLALQFKSAAALSPESASPCMFKPPVNASQEPAYDFL